MLIPIVDEDDIQIGSKEREEIEPGDLYRVSALWLTNSEGEILIARRSLAKRNNPGTWGPAVAGTVDEGKSYEANMVKEAQEELGLVLVVSELAIGPKMRRPNYFCQWYVATCNIPRDAFTLPPDEVMDVEWIAPEALRTWVSERPHEFVGSMPSAIEEFLGDASNI